MGNKDDQKAKHCSKDDKDDDIVCCEHGRPCPKANEKRKKKQTTETEEHSIYENMVPAINGAEESAASTEEEAPKSSSEASNYDLVPDGGLGSTDEATGEEDDEGISTAKEHDDEDEDVKPKVYKRTEHQNRV